MGKGSAGEEGLESLGVSICLCCCIGLPLIICVIAMAILFIYYGFVHMDNCPAEKMIPIWAIVQGFSMLVGGSLGNFTGGKAMTPSAKLVLALDGQKTEDENKGKKFAGILVQLFQAVWMIYGSVLVFGCGDQCENDFEPVLNTTTGCAHDLYWMTYVSLIISYCLIPVIIIVVISVMRCTKTALEELMGEVVDAPPEGEGMTTVGSEMTPDELKTLASLGFPADVVMQSLPLTYPNPNATIDHRDADVSANSSSPTTLYVAHPIEKISQISHV